MAAVDPFHSFAALDGTAWTALEAACAGVLSVAADTDLIRQGEAPDRLHVLVDGWACRYRLLDDGRRHIPALLLPCDPCDLDGLGAVCLPYGIATLTRCRVAVWPHGALGAVMDQHPGVGAALLRLAFADNMIMTQTAVVLGRLCGRERLAHLLCEILARLEAVGLAEPDGCALPVTQVELGDTLGLSAVHVNRTLQELRGEGLIRLEGGRLTVLDREGLRAAGQFQPDYLRVERTAPGLLRGPQGASRARTIIGRCTSHERGGLSLAPALISPHWVARGECQCSTGRGATGSLAGEAGWGGAAGPVAKVGMRTSGAGGL